MMRYLPFVFMLLTATSAISQDATPLVGDEIPLVRIKADPMEFLGDELTITGMVEISDYYNYRYDDTEEIFYSLRFTEVTGNPPRRGEDIQLYLRRTLKPIVDAILNRILEEGKRQPLRVKAVINPQNYDNQWDLMEVVDAQILMDGQWSPWVVSVAKEQIAEEALEKLKAAEMEAKIEHEEKERRIAEEKEKRRRERTRVWKDASEKFSVEAEFFGLSNDVVRLKRTTDGKEIKISLDKLSKECQNWINQRR